MNFLWSARDRRSFGRKTRSGMAPFAERQVTEVPDPEEHLATWGGDTLLNRLERPEEIAIGVLLLTSDESSFKTCAALVIDGACTAKSRGAIGNRSS
jgi:NAD(P)-dependent dehydrogenase (short-subunit alcohol dehydrogenase family)